MASTSDTAIAPPPGGEPQERGRRPLRIADTVLLRHPVLAVALPYPVFLLAGFGLTRVGTSTWDTVPHLQHGLWLLGKWRGEELPLPYFRMKWIGPLWEYVLAGFGAVFTFLNDPLCVRHAVTFSLLPVTLLATYLLLRRSGETPGTAFLAVAVLAGNVRFLGHALLNVKDFPFACGYLLVTLAMWVVLHEKVGTPAGLARKPRWLVCLVLLSIVPYLLRVPVFHHWLLLVGLSLWGALSEAGDAGWARRWAAALLAAVVGPLVAFVVLPGLWETGPSGFVSTALVFSSYPWEGPVRLFGTEVLSTELPWWYGPVWVAVSWNPVGLVTLAIGGARFVPLVVRDAARRGPWPLGPLFGSLPVWVTLFGATPWLAVLVMRPTLYDEDRHLLFAMPLLAVGAALGLRGGSERVKGALACLVLASAAWSAVSWGKYAYVYRNPLLPRSADEDFMGDYWGASTGALAQALYDRVPQGAYVLVLGRGDALDWELGRRGRSLLVRGPERRSYDLRQKARRRGQFYVASTNRSGAIRPLLEDVAAGKARELWREELPGGGIAGLLVYYGGPCEDCPQRLHN